MKTAAVTANVHNNAIAPQYGTKVHTKKPLELNLERYSLQKHYNQILFVSFFCHLVAILLYL